mmetsp:Transcript_30777/g.76397  ORF Transcript_30777/g.76397 Transcript_30777/m.76397 type:complete len:200 (-) Transcript_30777:1021-1620(-)
MLLYLHPHQPIAGPAGGDRCHTHSAGGRRGRPFRGAKPCKPAAVPPPLRLAVPLTARRHPLHCVGVAHAHSLQRRGLATVTGHTNRRTTNGRHAVVLSAHHVSMGSQLQPAGGARRCCRGRGRAEQPSSVEISAGGRPFGAWAEQPHGRQHPHHSAGRRVFLRRGAVATHSSWGAGAARPHRVMRWQTDRQTDRWVAGD